MERVEAEREVVEREEVQGVDWAAEGMEVETEEADLGEVEPEAEMAVEGMEEVGMAMVRTLFLKHFRPFSTC